MFCDNVPEVAVTVRVEVPLGVPPELAQPAKIAAVRKSASGTMAAERRSCGIRRIAKAAYSARSSAANEKPNRGRSNGVEGGFTGEDGGATLPPLVVIVRVTVVCVFPGVTVTGMNEVLGCSACAI